MGILYALQSAVLFWSNDFERGFELRQRALALMPKGSVWWGRNVQNLVVIASCLPDMSPMHKLAEHCADETLEQMAPIPCVQAVGTLVMELGILGERARARHFLAMAEKVCGQLATDQGVARGYLDACRAWQVICSEPNPWLAYCCGQQAGRLHRTAEDWRSLMISELALALSLGELGDNQQGIETARQMLVLSERLREPFMVLASKAYLLYLLASRPGDHLGAEASTLIDETKQAPLFTVQGLAHIASARFALYRNDPVYAESEARAAIRSLPIMLPYRLAAFTALINALLVQGRQDEARATAEEGMAQLAGAGGAGFTEVPLRLAASETFYAAGDSERARAEHSEVLRQIQIRADSIADLTWRDSYLSRNPTCVHAQQLSSSRFRRDQHDVAITRIDSDSRT